MKMFTYVAAAILLASLTGSLFAAPHQPSGQPTGSPGTLTFSQAQAEYGRPDSIYLDGKGGSFWLFVLRHGRRMMIEVAPQDKPMKERYLPWSWQPTPGGHLFKSGGGGLTFIPAPRRSIPALPTPVDRYHPGIKLLARSGDK